MTADQIADRAYQKATNFRRSEQAGVPADYEVDGENVTYPWEFAAQPVRHYNTAAREAQALVHLDLINTDFSDHPMHVTVGCVTSEGLAGNEALVLARGSERVRQPERMPAHNWAAKRSSGVKEREVANIELGIGEAVELRVLEFNGVSGFNRLASQRMSSVSI